MDVRPTRHWIESAVEATMILYISCVTEGVSGSLVVALRLLLLRLLLLLLLL